MLHNFNKQKVVAITTAITAIKTFLLNGYYMPSAILTMISPHCLNWQVREPQFTFWSTCFQNCMQSDGVQPPGSTVFPSEMPQESGCSTLLFVRCLPILTLTSRPSSDSWVSKNSWISRLHLVTTVIMFFSCFRSTFHRASNASPVRDTHVHTVGHLTCPGS